MLSRSAQSLYWMARYLERAENTARLINATQQLSADDPVPPAARRDLEQAVREGVDLVVFNPVPGIATGVTPLLFRLIGLGQEVG